MAKRRIESIKEGFRKKKYIKEEQDKSMEK